MKQRLFISLFLIVFTVILFPLNAAHADYSDFNRIIGKNDALLVKDQSGNTVLSINADNKLIPASTLKVLTALTAFHYLGDDYRFKTEFYLDRNSNLIVRGYGDPLLVSEVISKSCENIKPVLLSRTKTVNRIVIDQTYFEPTDVPGVTNGSYEPYNAPIGALSANFNTVNFFRDKEGNYVSAEEQTPIFHFLNNQIKRSGLNQGRIILKSSEQDLYAGSLFKFFLEKQGIVVNGDVTSGSAEPKNMTLLYTMESPYTLKDVVKKLLEYSNNYIANQLIVSVGAKAFGEPGNLSKGTRAIRRFTEEKLGIKDYSLVEGSGLSRENRISAQAMSAFLDHFVNYRSLMRTRKNVNFKTGTLTGISTRVGYFTGPDQELYSFVIFCNTPGKSAEKIERMLYPVVTSGKHLSYIP